MQNFLIIYQSILVPKLIQLFTGQHPEAVPEVFEVTSKMEQKVAKSKVTSETQTPAMSIQKNTKLEESISEFESQIKSMFEMSNSLQQGQTISESNRNKFNYPFYRDPVAPKPYYSPWC